MSMILKDFEFSDYLSQLPPSIDNNLRFVFNPHSAKLYNLNFYRLESRYRDPQFQAVENYIHMYNLNEIIYHIQY